MSDLLEDKKQEVAEIRQERMQGVATRARIQWLKEGEKPSIFFCSLEKCNFIEKTIKCKMVNVLQIRKKYWPLLENVTSNYFHKNRVAKTYNITSS